MIKKLAAILALFAMAFIPLRNAIAGEGTKQFRLGELVLSVSETSGNGDYLLKFSKGKEELFAGECAFKTHEPRTIPNTPLPNCGTLLAYCFSGGAHCCTTLFIATECGPKASLDMIDLGHTDGEVEFIQAEGTPAKMIRIHDWQFAYYGPEDSDVQLSFKDSPAMSRLLVFDNGRWRADRVGEFSQFYSRLYREAVHKARSSARKHEPGLTASLAMKAAYYDLMTGKPIEEVAGVLDQLFPTEWRSKTGMIVQDINSAVSGFNPLEAIK